MAAKAKPAQGRGKEFDRDELARLLTPDAKIDLRIERDLCELGGEFILLIVARSDNYAAVEDGILRRFLSMEKIPGVYVTTNKPFKNIKEDLERRNIDDRGVLFVDVVSKVANVKQPAAKNCEYIDSPTSLTEIMLALEKSIESIPQQGKFVVLDSLSTLLVYNEKEAVEKFAHSLIGKARDWGIKCVILMVESEEHRGVMHTVGQFCDRVSVFSGK